jgi:HTH-type transcriptional regulator/antitoxin HigA
VLHSIDAKTLKVNFNLVNLDIADYNFPEPEFTPNWASKPGTTISDILKERNSCVQMLAEQMGYDLEFVLGIIDATIPISNTIACKLAEMFGTSADFWMKRESQYRKSLERLGTTVT